MFMLLKVLHSSLWCCDSFVIDEETKQPAVETLFPKRKLMSLDADGALPRANYVLFLLDITFLQAVDFLSCLALFVFSLQFDLVD